MDKERMTAESCERTAATVSHLIRKRRTIRNFVMDPISPSLIEDLLQSAADSIAGENTELPCRFLLIASDEGKKKAASVMMEAYSEQGLYRWLPNKMNKFMRDRIAKIPAMLVIVMKSEEDLEKYERNYADVCAMLQSFSLLAWERGIGMVWGTSEVLQKTSFQCGLGLQKNERVHCLIYVGRFDKIPKRKPRTPASMKLTILS